MTTATSIIDAGRLADIEAKGQVVVAGGPVPIVVFCDNGHVQAVDNRCPHMGFPLHRGTVKDGILTCHWHHARFDLKSGCTFDLFADDVQAYSTEVRDGRVYVDVNTVARDPLKRGMGRLEEGMEQNIRLVMAKAVVTLIHGGADHNDIARAGALYGVRRRREGWASGLTILSAMANVADHLQGEERIAPYYQGLVHVAFDCAGSPPRIALRPLESADIELDSLQRWFRDLVEVRNPDGAERCLLSAISNGSTAPQLAEMMIAAATDHFYLDGGHVVDFVNKAFEMLDRIGWDLAGEILPSLVRHMCSAQRSEELNAWRSPVDLVSPLKEAFQSTPDLLREGEGRSWQRPEGLVDLLLSDDPHAIVAALNEAVNQGARAVQLAAAVTYASALRVARFHVQNEFPDWIGVLHTFTYNNALHQLLKRSESAAMLRGVYHGAMRVYLDRFLNIPPAQLPAATGRDGGNGKPEELLPEFLDLLNRQQQVDEAGQLVYG